MDTLPPSLTRIVCACLLAASVTVGGAKTGHAQETPSEPAQADTPSLSFGLGDAPDATVSTQDGQRVVIFSILAGAETRPAYFGSEENRVVPQFRPNLLSLSFGNLQVGDEDDALDDDPNNLPRGFGIGASFNFETARRADDYDELEGLEDVDGSVEAGILVGYAWRNAEAFGTLRYGFTGHNSWVGELGANYVGRPTDGLVLRIGPRLIYGAEEYNETYFGVTESESLASGLDAYDPGGGLVSAGVELSATYRLGERWWLEGRARWDQLQDDAADSPIVRQGTTDMGSVSIGVRRAFVLDF